MKKITLIIFIVISTHLLTAQVTNVPLDNPVYTFLKEMKLKRVIYYDDAIPNLSRQKVKEYLTKIEKRYAQLSGTEKELLTKYRLEFFEENLTHNNAWQMFGSNEGFADNLISIFEPAKMKYLYRYADSNATLFINAVGHGYYGHRAKPDITNSELYDIGFRFRGTLFDNLGYYFYVAKGGISGNNDFAAVLEPDLRTNFKYIEDTENIGNYDFTDGYLRYQTNPVGDLNLAFQIGREEIRFGYGYGSKFIISGDNPNLDFVKLDVDYGIVHYTSLHASTVGEFNFDRSKNFTKYFAFNKVSFHLKDLFTIGIGESIVYNGRGIDLAYINPLLFYKFAEMSLQDRDNGLIFFDFQSDFIDNVELQATLLMDENILSNLGQLNRYSNKTGYQLGGMWYETLGVEDLTLGLEYTMIRPYVYTHKSFKNSYTSFGVNMGHEIGPNADQLFATAAYNLNACTRLSLEYSKTRSGENEYDAAGNLVKNYGGDIFVAFRNTELDDEFLKHLDGIRVDTHYLKASLLIEPIREVYFDISYHYRMEENITYGTKDDLSYLMVKMTLEY